MPVRRAIRQGLALPFARHRRSCTGRQARIGDASGRLTGPVLGAVGQGSVDAFKGAGPLQAIGLIYAWGNLLRRGPGFGLCASARCSERQGDDDGRQRDEMFHVALLAGCSLAGAAVMRAHAGRDVSASTIGGVAEITLTAINFGRPLSHPETSAVAARYLSGAKWEFGSCERLASASWRFPLPFYRPWSCLVPHRKDVREAEHPFPTSRRRRPPHASPRRHRRRISPHRRHTSPRLPSRRPACRLPPPTSRPRLGCPCRTWLHRCRTRPRRTSLPCRVSPHRVSVRLRA